ncbi:MAG: hypothetical protein KY446_10990 [Proteobacteria bacterium]|nr:hypothetical protein [Pseudomonadota bacterium]
MAGVEQALIELLRLDQSENRNLVAGTDAYRALRDRDRARRERAQALMAQEYPSSPEALYAAAWLFNHGDEAAEARTAHELARLAAELGHRPARWLAAAALDRSLMYSGLPQKYGTNIVPDGVRHRVWEVDPATTDAERAAWDVPPLAEMQARAVALNQPMPPMDSAPEWLLSALKRWRNEGAV